MSTFSKSLIRRCKQVFEKKAGRSISDEEAEMFLESLARIGKIFVHLDEVSKIIRDKKNKK